MIMYGTPARSGGLLGLLLLLLALLLTGPAHAASIANVGPTAAAGTGWTNPTRVYYSDNSRASSNATGQPELRITGFDFSSLADGVPIAGITVRVEGYQSSGTSTNRQYNVGMTKNGLALAGTRKLDTFTTADSIRTLGGISDLWGATWTTSDIKSPGFGILLRDNTAGATGTFYIDHVTISVEYTDNVKPVDGLALTAVGGNVANQLQWSAAYDNVGVNYYRVVSSTSALPAVGCTNGTQIYSGTDLSYTHAGLSTGTTYHYRVCAYDGVGNVSNGLTASAIACTPTNGPLVYEGGTLIGKSVDLLSLVTANGIADGSISNVNVSGYLAPDFDELESFEGGGAEGWSAKWTTTNAGSPPGNRDLMTDETTRSDGTGPGSAASGTFLFYESSAGTGTERFLTHVDPFSADNNDLSISFIYNMNGPEIGTLELQLSHNGGAWTTVWGKTGNQADVWRPVNLALKNLTPAITSGQVRARFRFAYGGGYLGDIALDEVRVSGPGRSDNITYFDGTGSVARTAVANGTAGRPLWPENELLRLAITAGNSCGSTQNLVGSFNFVGDFTAPTILGFSLPASAVSPILIGSLTAADNAGGSGVTGYLVTESATPPSPTHPGWTPAAPTRITTANTGAVTFYAWAKDAGNNISAAVSRVVNVSTDVTAPVVDAFSLPASSYSPIAVTAFSAHDDSGLIAGYMITESAVPPAAGAGGWSQYPPATVSHGVQEPVTFRAWAKDAAGNVSAPATATVQALVDTTKPTITAFTLPASSTSLTIPVTAFTATDNVAVTAYQITTTATPPASGDANWRGTPPTSVKATITADPQSVTFYAWAKDGAGNVSNAGTRSVTVDLPDSCDFDIDPAGTYIEAEHFTNMEAPNPWSWTKVDTPLADSAGQVSSGGYLNTTVGGTGTAPQGSRVDYPVNFPTDGTYYIWIRALDGAGTGGGDSSFWGLDGAMRGAITQTSDNRWAWTNGLQLGSRSVTVSAGQHILNLWPRETGQKVDAFFITTDSRIPPQIAGQNVFTGNEDQITTVAALAARGVKVDLDPTCVTELGGGGGGGSDTITIPDGQKANGTPLNPENFYSTSLGAAGREYRALGAQTDAFNGGAVNTKWYKTDIGGDSTPAPYISNGKLTLIGSGANIGGTRDTFSYLYQPNLRGSFTIDVDVAAVGATNAGAKAGIMVRQSLTNNSAFAMAVVTYGQGAQFLRRTSSGATATATTTTGVTAPRWLRLKRAGGTFTAFYSADARSWTELGSANIAMSDPVNIGLAVTSANASFDNYSSFDNFLFMPANTSGMSESWLPTSSASPGSINAGNWQYGYYGLAVRSTGATVAPTANTFLYSTCNDATPSTLKVKTGLEVGGSLVSLPGLFTHTGNVGKFKYRINGAEVQNPWNSLSEVPAGMAEDVTFEVIGTDPDCGTSTLVDSGLLHVDNACVDNNPSSITIRTGQSVGGSHVDLTKLFTYTGDVSTGGFTYRINGNIVGDPTAWDSRAYGTNIPESVNLEVSGFDPPCSHEVAATNSLEVDNACVTNKPSLSFNTEHGYVGEGRAVPFRITVRNEDSFNCAPSTITVTRVSDSNDTDFEPSYFPSGTLGTDARYVIAGDKRSATIELGGREAAVIELAATAKTNAVEWESNVTNISVSSGSGNSSKALNTTIFLVSPITHNSITTQSSKWGGKWGTSQVGSKYGNFDCLTCHKKDGEGVKWLSQTVETTNAAPWGTSGSNTLPVTFQDARPGSSDWGDDDPNGDGSGRIGSTHSCEVCHSTTMYHRYDTEADPDGAGPLTAQTNLNHFPNRDCIDCHRHSIGFTASCTGCHGNPPLTTELGGPDGLADIPGITGSATPGTHYKHVVVLGYDCEYCHAGWRAEGEMPKTIGDKQDINHRFNVFDKIVELGVVPAEGTLQRKVYDTAVAGHYTGQDGVSYEGTVIPAGQGTMTCENIYCHGGTDNMGGTNARWNGNVACTSCHGTSATNTPPGFSHSSHVGKMGQPCWYCHGGDGNPRNDAQTGNSEPGSDGHVNGSVGWDLSGLAAAYGTPYGTPTYKGAIAGETGTFAPSSEFGTYGTCSNIICHYGEVSPVWNNDNQPATCITCHHDGSLANPHDLSGNAEYQALTTDAARADWILRRSSPNTGNHLDHVHPEISHAGDADVETHKKMVAGYINKCESCHGGGSNSGNHPGHIDYSLSIGGAMSYNSARETCTSTCHGPEIYNVWGLVGGLPCAACHAAPYLGPTVVDPDNEGTGLATTGYGSHLKALKTDTLTASTDWDVQCRKCHPYHGDEGHTSFAKVPLPPTSWDNPGTVAVETYDMQERLGLKYSTGGVHLGGSATSGNTEAQICWNCHSLAANSVSEWGTNTSVATGNSPYNYGSLSTSNWTTANWTSGVALFGYKTAAIQSTHAAGMGAGIAGVKGVDPVANIRCTYCHDVHDLNMAVQNESFANESFTGKPYLRGSWLGNPYKEDGAPRAGTTFPSNTSSYRFGAVPRGKSNTTNPLDPGVMGGFWIDQNSGNPTADWSPDDFGGLCETCHGNGDGIFTAAEIGSLNYFGAQGAGWVSGYNGHANSVQGGAGPGTVGSAERTARNIFNLRGGTLGNQINPAMGFQGANEPGENSRGFRNGEGSSYGFNPRINSAPTESNLAYTTVAAGWAITIDAGTTNANYHKFSCSKCHNPHASRLPALMITNCLDVRKNTWDDALIGPSVAQFGTLNRTQMAMWTSAQNCHRYLDRNNDGDTLDAGDDKGWNTITPW
ncbi:MAG: CxxxxCH/CxxCH domain c-type cytochrome [Trichloromonadaceae bacterium]